MFKSFMHNRVIRALALILCGYILCGYFQSSVDLRHVFTYQCGAYQQQSVWQVNVQPYHPAPPVNLFGN